MASLWRSALAFRRAPVGAAWDPNAITLTLFRHREGGVFNRLANPAGKIVHHICRDVLHMGFLSKFCRTWAGLGGICDKIAGVT
jgi:hypothetical protein